MSKVFCKCLSILVKPRRISFPVKTTKRNHVFTRLKNCKASTEFTGVGRSQNLTNNGLETSEENMLSVEGKPKLKSSKSNDVGKITKKLSKRTKKTGSSTVNAVNRLAFTKKLTRRRKALATKERSKDEKLPTTTEVVVSGAIADEPPKTQPRCSSRSSVLDRSDEVRNGVVKTRSEDSDAATESVESREESGIARETATKGTNGETTVLVTRDQYDHATGPSASAERSLLFGSDEADILRQRWPKEVNDEELDRLSSDWDGSMDDCGETSSVEEYDEDRFYVDSDCFVGFSSAEESDGDSVCSSDNTSDEPRGRWPESSLFDPLVAADGSRENGDRAQLPDGETIADGERPQRAGEIIADGERPQRAGEIIADHAVARIPDGEIMAAGEYRSPPLPYATEGGVHHFAVGDNEMFGFDTEERDDRPWLRYFRDMIERGNGEPRTFVELSLLV